jgi:hypothetical protein
MAIASITITIGDQTSIYETNLNSKLTSFQAIGAYIKKHGAYDVLCVLEKSFEGAVRSANILGATSKCIQDLNSIIKSLGSAKDWLIISKILSATSQSFNKSFWAFKQSFEGFFSKKTVKLIHASLELFLDLLSFGLLFRISEYARAIIKLISLDGSLILHSWDIGKDYLKLIKANWLEETCKNADCAPENRVELDNLLKENKRCSMLKVAVSVANLIKDFISLIETFFGHILITSFLWPLGVVVLVLRISKDYYSDSMAYIKK